MTLNDPFATHPPVPSFTVTSTTFEEGDTLGLDQMSGIFGVPGGKDVSPQLSWSGAPAETQGYAVTIYDPDAPTGCGFFHWAVATLPADCTDCQRTPVMTTAPASLRGHPVQERRGWRSFPRGRAAAWASGAPLLHQRVRARHSGPRRPGGRDERSGRIRPLPAHHRSAS